MMGSLKSGFQAASDNALADKLNGFAF